MDSLRSIDGDEVERDFPAAEEPVMEAPPSIGSDERRMHVRAYNHWVSMLKGRPYPAIAELDPATVPDFGPHGVVLDFTDGATDPAIPFVGAALREEGGHDRPIRHVSDVPPGSLLSRLTDHIDEIIANHAPIGFEAEFVNQRGRNMMYRGILMPFSADAQAIDAIYGVINWKEAPEEAISKALSAEVARALQAPAVAPVAGPVWADGPNAAPLPDTVLPEADYAPPRFDSLGNRIDAVAAPEAVRRALRAMPARAAVPFRPAGDEEFVLLLARRDEAGGLAILAPVEDDVSLERAMRRLAG